LAQTACLHKNGVVMISPIREPITNTKKSKVQEITCAAQSLENGPVTSRPPGADLAPEIPAEVGDDAVVVEQRIVHVDRKTTLLRTGRLRFFFPWVNERIAHGLNRWPAWPIGGRPPRKAVHCSPDAHRLGSRRSSRRCRRPIPRNQPPTQS